MAHPYPESQLKTTMSTLGKAFDFAVKHVPGGVEGFYDQFVHSSVARSFDGPGTTPAVSGSGIELVLAVTDGSTAQQGLDIMLMSERRLSKDELDRARWCGEMLAFYQWDTGKTFQSISAYLSARDLMGLFPSCRVASPKVVSLRIEELFATTAASPTRLRTLRDKAGLTQAALAEASGVSLRAIQQYEQRQKDINKARAMSVYGLAKALGCRMEELLEV